MKKIVLLSLVSMALSTVWASDPNLSSARHAQKAMPNPPGVTRPADAQFRTNTAKRVSRSGALQKVAIGRAGNMLTVLVSKCHQIEADNEANSVVFIHRSDTVFNLASSNVAQYRYDLSKDGGNTWQVNIGPLNPQADNITINGRYPQATIMKDPTNLTVIDSAYLVYNGTWHNGGTGIVDWQGQYYGTAQLTGNPATFTEHRTVMHNAQVAIATSLVQSRPGYFFNVNQWYKQLSTTPTDSVWGIWIERGVWNNTTKDVDWTYDSIPMNGMPEFNTSGLQISNALTAPTISFDPTGRYGWILLTGDLINDANYSYSPILLHSTDFGATWSAPQQLYMEGMPGIFPGNSSLVNTAGQSIAGHGILGDAVVSVDSAGNPHIFCVVSYTDTSSNTSYGNFYPFQMMGLYDINYNPAIAGCSWQANFLDSIFSYSADYTAGGNCNYCNPAPQTAAHDGNRIQVARTADGNKMFVLWNETDHAVAAATATGTGTADQTNINPNLLGIGIDLTAQKTTNVVDFTAGDPMFGGQITGGPGNGSLGGSLYPVVSTNVRIPSPGNYNIPVVLTEPDYLTSGAVKYDGAAARFWYCQNINFTQADFVNRYNNAPPTLTVSAPDTVVLLYMDSVYDASVYSASAFDCAAGNITPQVSTTVLTNASHVVNAIGIYHTTWTATNPNNGNSSTHTQVVIVAAKPVAAFSVTFVTCTKFTFTDTSHNYPTGRVWYWGDGSSPNNQNAVHPTHIYSVTGHHSVILQVTNRFGTSRDTQDVYVCAAGINDVSVSNSISVYPNPSAGRVTVEFMDDTKDGAKVTVYDILGNIATAPFTIKANTAKSELDLTALPSGAYLMQIETSKGTAVKEISINK